MSDIEIDDDYSTSSDSSSSSSESEKIGGLNLRKNDKKITNVPITSIYDDEIELEDSDDETENEGVDEVEEIDDDKNELIDVLNDDEDEFNDNDYNSNDEDDNDHEEDEDNDEDNEDDDGDGNGKNTKKQSGGKKINVKINLESQNTESDDDSDSNSDDENYLQKFNSELNKNYIMEFHPECMNHNYDEITALSKVTRDEFNIIIDPLHKTIPYLTKYEKTRILGQRSKQIECGAKPLVKVPENIIDSYIIAELELQQKRIPFIIRRPLPNGGSEYWNLKDLEVITF